MIGIWRFFSLLPMALLWANASAGDGLETWREPLTGISFVHLPKGCFQMGSDNAMPPSGSDRWKRIGYVGSLTEDELPRHEVCLDSFWIARHEVRQSDWHRVMESKATGVDVNKPATDISWHQAKLFIKRLNEHSVGQYEYRLPTEAEWEYACMARRKEVTFKPSELDKMAHGGRRASGGAASAKSLEPNDWGLYDMLGNVWEWVEDGYQRNGYTSHQLFNPLTVTTGGERVIRGGSYRSKSNQLRCANRGFYTEGEALPQIGFRLVMTQQAGEGE